MNKAQASRGRNAEISAAKEIARRTSMGNAQVHNTGTMTKLTYLSSAGIVALLNIARLFRGEALYDIEAGWNTIRSLDRERGGGMQKNVKLLNVTPEVHNVLDMVGIVDFFEMHAVPAEAVASF